MDREDYIVDIDIDDLQVLADEQNCLEVVSIDHHISLERAKAILKSIYPDKTMVYYHMDDYSWPTGANNSFKYHPFITYNYRQPVHE